MEQSKIISIIRDIVEIEETMLNLVLLLKWIKIRGDLFAKFYIDFENKDGRETLKDIALEVERLKKLG
jgi:carboxyl-terminal processing protease